MTDPRGTTTQRGYGTKHQALKRKYEQAIARGQTLTCVRCDQPITGPVTPDHNPQRDGYLGPAHPTCNLKAAGREGAAISNTRSTITRRPW